MDNIGSKLEDILQNPEKIQKIMEMASTMGLSAPLPEDLGSGLQPQELMQQVSGLIQQTETKDKRQQTLIRALLPYLNPKRQARLERAVQLSHMSRLAGAALRNGAVSRPVVKEDDIHI